MIKSHPKKNLLELAEWIDESQYKFAIYNVECNLFDHLLRFNDDKYHMMDEMPIDQQIYFVLLVNEATK